MNKEGSGLGAWLDKSCIGCTPFAVVSGVCKVLLTKRSGWGSGVREGVLEDGLGKSCIGLHLLRQCLLVAHG